MNPEGTYDVRHVSVTIGRPARAVYAFAADGANLPRWATGLGGSIRPHDGEWIVDGPLGRIRLRFAPPNELGVLDHDVVLDSGVTVHNAMRVIPNGAGCTVVFTVLRLPGVTEEKFLGDAQWVERDLTTLKRILEGAD